MQGDLVFTEQEYADRLAAVRARMVERRLDLSLISTPENIYYLTGLDHWGYFAPHVLIVPVEGEPTLITRDMERATVANQVRNARFVGHAEDETAADVAARLINDLGKDRLRIGMETWSSGLPHGLAQSIRADLPEVGWVDVSSMVDALRLVKSAAEQNCVREAAHVSDAAMLAAIETIGVGATEQEVAAECHRAMILAGGRFPGFGPFIRPASRIAEEHTSWGNGVLSEGDAVLLELAGCVGRYHAPVARLVFVGRAPKSAQAMSRVCHDAYQAAIDALRPGELASEVYAAWHRVLEKAGLGHYQRHHCGYLVGIGFPPSWTGGNTVTGLRSTSDLVLQPGMTFHLMSWLLGTGRGDYILSDTVLLGERGPETLTKTPSDLLVR